MYIDFKQNKNLLLVSLNGELDHHSSQEVRVKIDDRLDKYNVTKLVFDFSGVTFMDSSGIGVIIGRYKKLSVRSGKVAIASVSSGIKRIFDLSGIFKVIDVYKTVDDAVENI